MVARPTWYLSDRGDAPGALRLWRRLGVPEAHNQDLREVTQFAEPAPSGMGRNEPCWCGSERKFKHCHLGQPTAFALPERVGWLCRKAVAYLERRGGEAPEDVHELAVTRAGGDDSEEALDRASSDPIVLDVALHEGGWFDRFIEERGALLPDDEALLARAWTLVDRTLYEVVGTDPGRSMSVRDLRSAEVVQVRERTFSRQAHVGQVICGRAVPDGETNQFIGGIFHVPTGQEKPLLDMLDEGDGHGLLAWLAARERPPRMTTREGEDMRVCRAVLEVPDPEVARGGPRPPVRPARCRSVDRAPPARERGVDSPGDLRARREPGPCRDAERAVGGARARDAPGRDRRGNGAVRRAARVRPRRSASRSEAAGDVPG